ncbi:hypothetical protein DSO57_1026844 [Entomophthora muscae]|uniref:Uncharacterized protein n=1 Tax=Entomophthora muscae TaxID=34485 RepID=A0ACC2RT06_9FUNG|nr:hypothetical protein DSO57_1026844 [Entomophthora muscae]
MDIPPIEPSFIYPEGNVPVFAPTEEQFKDFTAFINQVLPYGQKAGIIKVIPPTTWKGRSLEIASKLKTLKIRKSIQQNFLGSSGIYKQTNIESRKKFTVEEFKALCSSKDYCPPKVNRRLQEAPNKNSKPKGQKSAIPITPPRSSPAGNSPPIIGKSLKGKDEAELEPHPADSLTVQPKLTIDKSKLYQLLLSTHDLKELERHYWRNISFIPPYYGADLLGTLFDDSVEEWNLRNLNDLLHNVTTLLPGVNTPYLYFGMWRATFAWHVEDLDLFSINYIHQGAPKQWYAIPPAHRERFERFMKGLFSESREGCPEFLRHKTCLVSPKVLAHNNIPVNKVVQYEGEFIITFPHGYHAGYNLDFNIAESVNFATDYWIDIGAKAKFCSCLDDSVRIDMSIFRESIPSTPNKRAAKPFKVNTSLRKSRKKTKKPQQQIAPLPTPPQIMTRKTRVSTLGLQPVGKVYFNCDETPVKKPLNVCFFVFNSNLQVHPLQQSKW